LAQVVVAVALREQAEVVEPRLLGLVSLLMLWKALWL
jgi:hypothetical protein